MKKINLIKQVIVGVFCFALVSCEDFLEIETPDSTVVSEVVFNSDVTALSAMQGIYNQLSTVVYSNGGRASVTALTGLSVDVFTPIWSTNLPYLEFDQHDILPTNSHNQNLWDSAYNVIYLTNSLLEGLVNSGNISVNITERLEGEARFVRAFTFFYLVNLYGDVPLTLDTNYKTNSLIERSLIEEVYDQILEDLQIARNLLNGDDSTERTRINRNTATAMLARIHLYLQNWEKAESLSTEIIGEANYQILEDLDQVFLANSREAIWQLSPEGRGDIFTHTNEGSTFIINPYLLGLSNFKLMNDFVFSFDEKDKRLSNWINFHQGAEGYYPFKYKIWNSTTELSEYSMIMRLSEQYFIRAEARVMQNDLLGAMADVDVIRKRAGLESLTESKPELSMDELFDVILEERKKELFTEWGHRWFDLNRTNKISEVLRDVNPSWEDTDRFYPIPESELLKNPNLSQNPGY